MADKERPNNYYELDQNTLTIKFNARSFTEGEKIMQNNFNAKAFRKAQTGYVDYKLSKGTDFFESIKNLKNQSSVEDIVINTIGKYNDFTPNDQHYSDQWYLNKILMPKVWDIIEGNPCVVVAIIDSGTDWMHEDIGEGSDSYSNLNHNGQEDSWSNPSNPTTGNGIDDDGNGFVDDWIGWDFENQDNDARATSNSHGTQVAGIVSAKTNNNNTGIAGIGGNLTNGGILLMPIKIGESAPIGNLIDDAILYAVNNGADVIQMSLGVCQSNAIDAAIQTAENNNIPVICASGNGYSSAINYPASNQNVISVGATNQNDYKCDFSNYGSNLFISAPGKDIYSTTLSSSYGSGDGTSFAAPQVSGIVALIKRINPTSSNSDVRAILMNTADKVGGYTYTNGRCDELGYGRLNAFAAIQAIYPHLSGPPSICSFGGTFTVNNPGGATISWTCSNNLSLSNPTGNSATITPSGIWGGTGTIQAVLTTNCGTITLPARTVWIGTIPPTQITGFEYQGKEFASDFEYQFGVSPVFDEYQWSVGGGTIISGQGTNQITVRTATVTGQNPVYFNVGIRVKNWFCGMWSANLIRNGSVIVGDGPLQRISPNPSDGQTTISIEPTGGETTVAETTVWDMEVYTQGHLLKEKKIKQIGRSATINTSGWLDGLYIVKIVYNGNVSIGKLIVKH